MGDILKGNLYRVDNLVCGYPGRTVLKGLSFSVSNGAFFGLIGPNGAGKTTLLRAMTKALRPKEGSVKYADRDIRSIGSSELARQIAVLPQLIEIPFSFTVEEFVAMGRFPHIGRFRAPGKEDMRAVEKALEMAEVSDIAERMIKNLSGGERQRALFAQALAQEPKALILDEPVSHLDIRHQIEAMDLLRRLNSDGITVILTLHDLNLAGEYCDRLLLLDGGIIRAEGEPKDVLTYHLIEDVYKATVIVKENPISKKPYIFLVSASSMKR